MSKRNAVTVTVKVVVQLELEIAYVSELLSLAKALQLQEAME